LHQFGEALFAVIVPSFAAAVEGVGVRGFGSAGRASGCGGLLRSNQADWRIWRGAGLAGFIPDPFHVAVFFFGFAGEQASVDGAAAALGGIQGRV